MEYDLSATLGQRLRNIRERSGFSLREVAKAANISAPFLSDAELGRRFPTNRTLALITQKLHASADDPKKHDHRSAHADLNRLSESSFSPGAAERALVDEVQAGNLSSDQLAVVLRAAKNSK